MVAFVLDGSVTLAAIMPDEDSPRAYALLDRVIAETATAPSVWPLEIANGLLLAVRRGRISDEFRLRRLSEVALFPVTVDPEGLRLAWSTISRLAAQHRLTAYDASYLELALRSGLPLATLDFALAAAARRVSVEVL